MCAFHGCDFFYNCEHEKTLEESCCGLDERRGILSSLWIHFTNLYSTDEAACNVDLEKEL